MQENKKITQKLFCEREREREGERGREKQPFCDGKLCKKWKRELQIYRRWCEYEETK